MYAGSMLAETGQGTNLHFKTLPTGSYVIAENANGFVDTLYRELWLTPRQAVQMFEGQVSVDMADQADKASTQDTPRKFLH